MNFIWNQKIKDMIGTNMLWAKCEGFGMGNFNFGLVVVLDKNSGDQFYNWEHSIYPEEGLNECNKFQGNLSINQRTIKGPISQKIIYSWP